ncbi:hypothetical protein [Tenacibaculum geojense]|uniref:DUF748 domain-containing protein n=1 Tax=Tenacibaculum geojense TaxID=915352 RepID=A0ABW3JP11_9FLAO
MKAKRKNNIIYLVLSLFAIAVSLNIYLSNYLESQLSKLLAKQEIKFTGDVSTNVLFGNIFVENIEARKDSLLVKAHRLEVKGVSYVSFLFNDVVKVSEISVFKPIISGVILDKEANNTSKNNSTNQLPIINIENIEIINGALSVKNNNGSPFKIDDFSLSLTNVRYKDRLISVIPFLYEDISFTLNKLEYQQSTTQMFALDKIIYSNNFLSIHNLEIIPLKVKEEYIYHVPYEKDLLSLCIKEISIPNFIIQTAPKLSFKATNTQINYADFEVFLDASVLNHPKHKKKDLYSKSLRELPIQINFDTIQIKNSKILYKEKLSSKDKAGELSFHNINAAIYNLSNTGNKETEIAVTSDFMNSTPFKVNWNFNVNNPLDEFFIKGNLATINAQKINSFIEPKLKVRVDGRINSLSFNLYGNNTYSQGDFAIDYENIKVKVLKNNKGVRKVLSWLVNLVLKNSSKSEMKEVKIQKLERDQSRSFWNFLWKNIEKGLKETMI